MRVHLLAIGTRMPAWVNQGFQAYAQRMPAECELVLREIPAPRRGRNPDVERLRTREGQDLLAAIPRDAWVVALDEGGRVWDTKGLAVRLDEWMHSGRDVCLLVGGPDGLSRDCRERAHLTWSLSPLTFPHPLVRILLAEQLYRAWSLLRGHPYHRG
ncbi:23S rRNA (pseudouridine(1915)-N(3))-methyltransferase RlmH [Ectothiorhodospira mobilis]|uniref:23S rRNA (pseudouridine(1915)-N(3))-methyltransferase RlmH n=1 Tax=Ectothiorhodospira mobilis TaxID=195064 RepID=UPI00190508F5|nr:23S rRNA (pseudouridine(1915)-N(3))-methyltransferase RlmH [Ectothiorhodospira mobilis]MBK1692879.1 23S rRNA (pseudouridine(1915)-N(3))-methyltransferase RlmH [Ectothiorhodospira mobilis]